MQLTQSFLNELNELPEIRLLSPANSLGIVTLDVSTCHASDIAELLNAQHVAVRAGSHCAMPLFKALNSRGAVRFSFAPYNSMPEVERAVFALHQALEMCR